MNTSILLPNWLQRCAENAPARLAIKYNDVSWSFADLDRQATRLARQLATLDIRQGSRVAVLAMNGLPFVVAVHALTRLGAILVPLNTRLTREELSWQIEDVQAGWLLSDSHFTELASTVVQELPTVQTASLLLTPEQNVVIVQDRVEADVVLRDLIDLDSVQSIMYTSGTTGKPKGVLITYEMLWWNAVGSALNLGHSVDDCWLACMPLFHIGGLSILIRSVINGISVLLYEKFDAQVVNKAIKEERVTIISVVTLMLQRMLAALDNEQNDARYPATLRCVLLGGGPAPRPLLEDCAARAIPVSQSYGLTESCSQAATLAPADALRKIGSAGRPLIQVQLRIVNEQGQNAQAGEPGVIHLKGPSITRGYDHRPEATAQAIHDGWLLTGDVGYLDEEGYLYVLDRRNDLIISGGENVYPAEIESILLSHPDIVEAGVCGQPDEDWGQVPIAFVHLKPGSTVTADALHIFLEPRLARYKRPKAIYITDTALPHNSAGKLLRRELPNLLP